MRKAFILLTLLFAACAARAEEPLLELSYGAHDIHILADSDGYRATSTLLEDELPPAPDIASALTDYYSHMQTKNLANDLKPLSEVQENWGMVRELGGHGGDVKILLEGSEEPFWMSGTTFPAAAEVEIDDHVRILSIAHENPDFARYVIGFMISKE